MFCFVFKIPFSDQQWHTSGTQKLPQNSKHKKQIEKDKTHFLVFHFTGKRTPKSTRSRKKKLHNINKNQLMRSHLMKNILDHAYHSRFLFAKALYLSGLVVSHFQAPREHQMCIIYEFHTTYCLCLNEFYFG